MGESREALMRELFAALASDSATHTASDGRTYSPRDMRELLQAWIPTSIVVKRQCELQRSIVVAAPHVSFDNWTEYFANRISYDLNCGEVLAKNFRDEDGGQIPVSIGRHIHVNRPTESLSLGGAERMTPRAREVFAQYRTALAAAGRELPIGVLIELHGHRRNLRLEVATYGVSEGQAKHLKQAYGELAAGKETLPQLAIEPLDRLRFAAKRAKHSGSLTSEVCRAALHIEIPRVCRENEDARSSFRPQLSSWLKICVETLLTQPRHLQEKPNT